MEWFDLLHDNKLIGLTLLNLFDGVNYVLVGLLFLALYADLKRVNVSFMSIAIFLCAIAISIYLSANSWRMPDSMSEQFALATSGEQKAMLLAAGQATLAIHNNATYAGTGIYPSFLFISIAGLIISAVMLHSKIFNKVTAYFGLIANIAGLGYYIVLAFAPAAVFIPLSISAPFLLIWYILVGLRLLKLGSGASGNAFLQRPSDRY